MNGQATAGAGVYRGEMGRPSAVARWVAVAALLALVACNRGDDEPAIETTDSTTSSSPTTVPSAPESATPPVSVPATRERAYLTAVRVDTKEDGGSRVVFEFDPALPGYKVDFVERPVTMDGSGDE